MDHRPQSSLGAGQFEEMTRAELVFFLRLYDIYERNTSVVPASHLCELARVERRLQWRSMWHAESFHKGEQLHHAENHTPDGMTTTTLGVGL